MTHTPDRRVDETLPLFTRPDQPEPRAWRRDLPDDGLRCVHRHFAAAAAHLARSEGCTPEQSARYAAASARFRTLIEAGEGLRGHPSQDGPEVPTGDGGAVSLVTIFLDACRRYRLTLPPRSLDPGLIHEATTLLSGLPWRLPERDGVEEG